LAFFKTADEKFEQGNVYIKRGEWDKARSAFNKALNKGTKESEIARIMIALLDLRSNSTVAGYRNATEVLKNSGELEVEFGLSTIKCSKLAVECEACAAELSALGMSTNGTDALKARAEALFAAAMIFRAQMGMNKLIIPEVYNNVNVTGIQRANALMAEGNENMAESVVLENPKRAAEYFQMALNYRRQLADANAEARIQEKIRLYSKAASCWICGREATGETIHFVSMPTDVTPLLKNSKQASPLSSTDNDMSIYVCKACYLAISKRADVIAADYHRAAMAEMRAMENRLMTYVNSRIR